MEKEWTVLLVDDSEDMHLLIRLILGQLSIKILEAYNGKDALEILNKNPVDLIVMDIEMPVLNGYETIKKIREIEQQQKLKTIPAMALSANISLEDKKYAFQCGFNVFMEKPFLRSVFIKEIKNLMQ
ncbi:MAG: response regulator [Spirochaetia bacterium]|nr:response regulator [Spirochaetia bacterium]